MKADRFIKISQGPTMSVYLHKVTASDGTVYTRAVETRKKGLLPVLFRHGCRIGRRPHEIVLL